jgi:hypothetical protein
MPSFKLRCKQRNAGRGFSAGMAGEGPRQRLPQLPQCLRNFRPVCLRRLFDGLPQEHRETVVNETVELLAPALRDEEGNWIADYVRLRFIARA